METLLCARHFLGVLGLQDIHYNKVTIATEKLLPILNLILWMPSSLNILFCFNT